MYLQQNPPVFRENTTNDPAISEYWLERTEKILKRLSILNEDKVECVTYMMEEEAAQWWKIMQRSKPNLTGSQESVTNGELGEAPQISWERFNGKLFPTC